jgi:hypothetical protein
MQAEGCSDEAIAAFRSNYEQLVEGATGLLPESEIQPVETLPNLDSFRGARATQPHWRCRLAVCAAARCEHAAAPSAAPVGPSHLPSSPP